MRAYFITFRSITFAQRGKAVLDQSGISNTMGRTPKWIDGLLLRADGYETAFYKKD